MGESLEADEIGRTATSFSTMTARQRVQLSTACSAYLSLSAMTGAPRSVGVELKMLETRRNSEDERGLQSYESIASAQVLCMTDIGLTCANARSDVRRSASAPPAGAPASTPSNASNAGSS
jgi:hypothetical protein